MATSLTAVLERNLLCVIAEMVDSEDLKNLRLVDTAFRQAVRDAHVLLRPSSIEDSAQLAGIFPNATALDLTPCGHYGFETSLQPFKALLRLVADWGYEHGSLAAHVPGLTRLQSLTLHGRVGPLPESISTLLSLQHLSLSKANQVLPALGGLTALTAFTSLRLCEVALGDREEALPEAICGLTALRALALDEDRSELRGLAGISRLAQLTRLFLDCMYALPALPGDELSRLTALEVLELSRLGLVELPEALGALRALKVLNLPQLESLRGLPEGISGLRALQTLYMPQCISLRALPEGLGALTALLTLNLWGCGSLLALLESLSALTGLRSLTLVYCERLRALPDGHILRSTLFPSFKL